MHETAVGKPWESCRPKLTALGVRKSQFFPICLPVSEIRCKRRSTAVFCFEDRGQAKGLQLHIC